MADAVYHGGEPCRSPQNSPPRLLPFIRAAARIVDNATAAGDTERVSATHAALGRVLLRRAGR